MKINKRGELTTQQIVILIVLVISFIVILYFLFRLNLGAESEKEICHNSVILRGNVLLSEKTVPLNCKRTYVCLSKDGSCESMTNPNIEKASSKEEVYRILAEEMADCWWMFGEGKIDYIGDKTKEANYCSICSQIAFDNSIRKIEGFESGEINKDEFYNYLSETSLSEGKQTYAEYFFGTKNIASLVSEISVSEGNEEGISTFGKIHLDENYFVMMGITSQIGNKYKWIGGVAVVVGILTLPFTAVGGAIILVSGVVTGVVGDDLAEKLYNPKIVALIVEGEGIDNEFMAPTIIEASPEAFRLLNCKDIVTLS